MAECITYKVTTELYTPRWKKFLRWIGVYKPLAYFRLSFVEAHYTKGEIINGMGTELLILEVE